jgi:putative heme-binding domain-containing protein
VGTVLTALADGDPASADAVVRGLVKGWPSGKPPALSDQLQKDIGRLLTRLSAERRGVLIRLASGWGIKQFAQAGAEVAKALAAKIADDKLRTEDRVAAAAELIGYQAADKAVVSTILDQITPQTPPELAVGLLHAVKGSESPDAAGLILDRMSSLTPAARSAGIGVLLTRADWAGKLVSAIDAGKVSLTDLALDQRQALADHPDQRVRAAAVALLKRGGALPNPDRQKVIDEFLPITKEKGDAANGKLVFKNQCSKCHMHTGEGAQVGPDLTGMAVHPKDHLIIDVLDPSRSVEGNFRLYRVVTKDGKSLQGMLAAESKTAVELIDTEGKKLTVLREDIDELLGSNKSLMPDGFEKQVSRKDLTDLLEFLTAKGKYLPLPLDKVATAVSTKGMFYSEESPQERLALADWKPRTVEGVPFVLVDPHGDKSPNVILLYGPEGALPPKMPKAVSLTCNTPVKAIHLLSGISGWGYPYSNEKTVSMTVRIHYANGQTEDHDLKNGEHFADYIR